MEMDLRYDRSRNLFSSGYLPHAVVGIHSGVSYYLAPFQGVMPASPSLLLDPPQNEAFKVICVGGSINRVNKAESSLGSWAR